MINGITWYWLLSYGIALSFMVLHSTLHGILWWGTLLFNIVWYYMVFHGNALFDLYCMILHRTVLRCMVLNGILFYISKCISKRSNAMQCNAIVHNLI